MQDLHTHTVYCDGVCTPEEMVEAAIEKGIDVLGFSVHSYLAFDESYCIKKEDIPKYKEEINFLKNKYKEKIKILCGIEQDYFSEILPIGYDYIIGSLHFVEKNGKYFEIDYTEENFVKIAVEQFGGDYYALAERYFEIVGNIKEKTGADIIGHIDLITKFNEGYKYFDETNERYVKAYKRAIDSLIESGAKVFEVNTGAISRGYRKSPYPSKAIADYIISKGATLIINSDAHLKETLCFEFDKWKNYYNI